MMHETDWCSDCATYGIEHCETHGEWSDVGRGVAHPWVAVTGIAATGAAALVLGAAVVWRLLT